MVIFVSGGSGSGKSDFAESLITGSEYEKRTYIATMRVWDDEGRKRVQRHRALRRDKGFDTIECDVNLGGIEPPGGAVLLEDLTNLFMNEFFEPDAKDVLRRVERDLQRLADTSKLLVIVGNDIFSAGDRLSGDMEGFYAQQGELNAFAASLADECWEVSALQPEKHFPEVPKNMDGLKLIIGGAHQGKTKWAAEKYDRGRGVTKDFAEAENADVFAALHEWLRTAADPIAEIDGLIEKNPNIAIVCDELGCGVAPVEAADRAWREKVGRTCCHLAEKARTVVRIWCGLPVILKGDKK